MNRTVLALAALALVVTGFLPNTPAAAQAAGNVALQDNPNELRIAVTPPGYDDIGAVLRSMGWTYTEIVADPGRLDESGLLIDPLTDYEFLTQFDVIFINCPFNAYDSARKVGESGSLERFVREGGTAYISDNAYEYIDRSFPGYIDFYDKPGDIGAQTIDADVVDPGLAQALNSSTLQLHFPLTAWVPIDSVSDEVTVFLSGDFIVRGDTPGGNSPLTASFPYGEGRVVYTAFHNEEQTTEEENKLLSYLVLLSTTQKLSAQLQESLAGSGYMIQEEILGSINLGDTSSQFTFANPFVTELAVGLNWQAGTLRLSVFKPDGSLFSQQEGPPPLITEIPDAAAGDWNYQVEALDVPVDNYPYVVQIGVPQVATPPTPASPPEIATTAPSAEAGNSGNDDRTQGARSPVLYVVLGLALLVGVVLGLALLVGVIFLVMRRRKA